jgi:hypothetical protein
MTVLSPSHIVWAVIWTEAVICLQSAIVLCLLTGRHVQRHAYSCAVCSWPFLKNRLSWIGGFKAVDQICPFGFPTLVGFKAQMSMSNLCWDVLSHTRTVKGPPSCPPTLPLSFHITLLSTMYRLDKWNSYSHIHLQNKKIFSMLRVSLNRRGFS